jgi:hypothetical protein
MIIGCGAAGAARRTAKAAPAADPAASNKTRARAQRMADIPI